MATYIRAVPGESHILQVRPRVPGYRQRRIHRYGMPSLSVYLPYYQDASLSTGDDKGTDRAATTLPTGHSARCKLVMQDYNAFAPDVQRTENI